jgi:hypothetical protein
MSCKRFLLALLLTSFSAVVSFSNSCAADKTTTSVASLSGIKGIGLVVEDVSPDVAQDGLSMSQIQADIAEKLRAAGITVLSDDALTKAPGMPFLHCNIFTIKNEADICAYHITFALYQMVSLIRKPALKQSVATWKIAGGGTVDASQIGTIRTDLQAYLEKFITAYKAAQQ